MSVAQSTILGVFVRIAAIGAGFLLQLILARTAGAYEYGLFLYALTLSSIFVTIYSGGMEHFLVRELSICYDQKGMYLGVSRGFLVFFIRLLIRRAVVSYTLFVFLFFFAYYERLEWYKAFLWLGCGVALMGSIPLVAAFLQAQRKVLYAQVVNSLLVPLLMLIWFLPYSGNVTSEQIAKTRIFLSAFVVAVGVFSILIGYRMVDETECKIKREDISLFFYMVVLGAISGRLDLLLLGFWHSAKDVGVYGIALQLAEFTFLAFEAMIAWLVPRMSKLYADGDMTGLQKMITESLWMTFGVTLLISLGLIFFAPWMLTHWYGAAFGGGQQPLILLVLARVIVVAMGPLGYIFVVGRRMDILIRGYILYLFVKVLFSILLIPKYDLIGAAMANGISNVLMASYLWVLAGKEFNIDTSIMGLQRGRG